MLKNSIVLLHPDSSEKMNTECSEAVMILETIS